MKAILFLFVCFSVSITFADDESGVYVHTFEEGDEKAMELPGVKVQKGAGRETSRIAALPEPQEQVKLISASGLSKELAGFDQVDLDIFFAKLARNPFPDTLQAYPNLPEEKLKVLKKLIGEKK